MATSTFPTFKAALKTRLAARSGLSAVLVSYGWPAAPTRKMLILGGADGGQEPAAMRPTPHTRYELYDHEVLFYVEEPGDAQQLATEGAFTLAAELENELRNDPTVNSTVRVAQIGDRFSLEERVAAAGRLAILTVNVAVKAKI